MEKVTKIKYGNNKRNLYPCFEILYNQVFHGCDSDVVWLQRDFSVYLVNVFDTHQAGKLLGLPRLDWDIFLNSLDIREARFLSISEISRFTPSGCNQRWEWEILVCVEFWVPFCMLSAGLWEKLLLEISVVVNLSKLPFKESISESHRYPDHFTGTLHFINGGSHKITSTLYSLFNIKVLRINIQARSINSIFFRLSLAWLLEHYCKVYADKQYQLADWRIR